MLKPSQRCSKVLCIGASINVQQDEYESLAPS